MNVLFITPWYPDKNNPAAGSYVKELARAVSVHSRVAVLHAYYDRSVTSFSVSEDVEEGIRVTRLRYPGEGMLSSISYLFACLRAFKRLKEDFAPDIIHAHVYQSGVIAVISGWLYRVPVVITEHAQIIDEFKSGSFQGFKNSMKVIFARFALKNAQLLILVSKSLREHIRALGIENNSRVIPNGVDTGVFHPAEGGERSGVKKLLFAGGLTPIKGVPYLLEAVSSIRRGRSDFTLDIVGDGRLRPEYEKMAQALGVLDAVQFRGRKSKEEMAKFMQECDFLILPSLYETFGIVLIEAMACGKPVITTSSGGQREFVNEKTGLIVPPGDSKSLADAIEYMLDHCREYPQQEIAGYIALNFGYSAVSRLLQDCYTDVLKEWGKR